MRYSTAFQIPARAVLYSLALLAPLAGCVTPYEPPAPEHPASELDLVLENPRWTLDSFALRGAAPGRLSILATERGVPQHAIRCAIFGDANQAACAGDPSCLPDSATFGGEAGMILGALDRSWQGDLVTFQGAHEQQSPYVYLYDLSTRALRPWVAGLEPTFAPGGEVVYVSSDRSALRSFDPDRAGNGVERTGIQAAANPAVSPDGRFIAYSAFDAAGDRRIFVHDRQDSRRYLPVSFGDHYIGSIESLDGADDDCPTWSPGSRFIAFRCRLREDLGREAIFITRPAADPTPVRVAIVARGEHITQLSWEESGERILAVVDGKLFAAAVPSRFLGR